MANNIKYTSKELVKLWDKYDALVHRYINSDRIEQIEKLFNKIDEKFVLTPCSTRYYGNYEGGLIQHSINTIAAALYVRKFFIQMGIEMERIPTKESCVFCAALHDIGKVGTENNEYYVTETSKWHIDNLNQFYKKNNEIINLYHSDRTIYLLQKYNIKISEEEYQAIVSHDGEYYMKNTSYKHRVELLTRILREADMLAFVVQSRKDFTDEELRE